MAKKEYTNEEKDQEQPFVEGSEVADGVFNTPIKPTDPIQNPTIIDGKIESRYFKISPNGDITMGDYENNQGIYWDQLAGVLRIRGGLAVDFLDIPNNVDANSFHVDDQGNTWWGANNADFAADPTNAPAYILNTGSFFSKSGTIGGWTISENSLSKSIINLDAANDRITVNATSVILDSTGITAIAGTIGGFTLASGQMYGGIIKTASTVGVGSTGVIMDTDGLRGYDSVLGNTFNLPTDGSAPTFSSGIIDETIFKIETNAVLRTSETVGDGSANSEGVLINNTGIYACEANQTLAEANAKIPIDGKMTAKNINIGKRMITIDTTDSIQGAINAVNTEGGGTVYLKAGMYVLSADIILYDNVILQGVTPQDTILNFNSTANSVKVHGSSVYTTGTVSINSGGSVVTGVGTSWLANVTTDHYILLGISNWFKVSSVDSNTQITIEGNYFGNDLAGATYRAAIVKNNVEINRLTVMGSTTYGITCQDTNNVKMFNVFSIYNGGSGIKFEYANWNIIDYVVSAYNTSHGYELLTTYNSSLTRIFCFNDGSHGFYTKDSEDNALNFLKSYGNTNDGLLIESSISCLFNQIDCKFNGRYGLYLYNGTTSNSISGLIEDNDNYGISISTGPCVDNIIHNSIISGNTTYGIRVYSTATRTLVIGNIFNDNGTNRLDESTTSVFRSNIGISDVDVQTFTANGTWTKPAGAISVLVEGWGAGGSGSAYSDNTSGIQATGGGGGEYRSANISASDLGSTVSITIGNGGASRVALGSILNGANGGNTSFGTMIFYGGLGGKTGSSTTFGIDGGDSGSLTVVYGGDIKTLNTFWGSGDQATGVSDQKVHHGIYSGAGGSTTGSGSVVRNGGNSIYGGGGGGSSYNRSSSSNGGTSISGGNGGNGAQAGSSSNATAQAGTAPGGGGGGVTTGAAYTATSGAGGKGQIKITTYF